jgi:signal peptidase I
MPEIESDASDKQETATGSSLRKKIIRSAAEWLFAVGVALIVYFILSSYVIRIASVDGNSMEPTLIHRDLVILSKISYIAGEPRPGDIVAFPYKENPSEYYIKRIVGLPGDVIDIDGRMFYINGEPLEDDFSSEPIIAGGDAGFPLTVPDGYYFVLGDNRNSSKDSRYSSVGCIPKKEMVGKVVLRFWPPSRFGTA